MFKKKQSNCVEIKVVTWDKDSHGLFDYESKSFNQKYYHIDTSCVLFQNQLDKQLEWTHDNNLRQLGDLTTHTCLGRISVNHVTEQFLFEKYELTDVSDEAEKLSPYLVVRSLKNEKGQQKGYSLKLGDIIKFGRLEYCILEYRDEKAVKAVHSNVNGPISLQTKFQVHIADKRHEGQCKICLMEQQDDENFLMSACNCRGSCAYVHVNCLRSWIQSKVHRKSHGVVDEYNFSKFECEICKVPYPKTVIRNSKQLNMLLIDKPKQPYIIMQAVTDKKNFKNLFVISFSCQNPTIKLGRGHECQMRMTDISVSRIHAHISHKNGKFIIMDNASKFGTLAKIQGRHMLTDERCAIQVGKTVVICVVKPTQALKFRKQIEPYSSESQVVNRV